DVVLLSNSTDPTLPTEQGQAFVPIPNAPKGKLHIFDSYATLQATEKLAFALEADYVIQRLYTNSAPSRTWGGAGYVRYQISPRIAIAGRTEYLNDQGGLFTGVTQALKETTVTLEQKMLEGFLLREEWRGDFSNRPYFYTSQLGILKREQNTATLGLVWWVGAKKSPW
ncbi:MAG TPA: outer membrane beta-barrel protein, partial [Bryobacteraceae bacterium]|nr:outer membrane beta-barrel protein [Bryobacteraceae bacterium]